MALAGSTHLRALLLRLPGGRTLARNTSASHASVGREAWFSSESGRNGRNELWEHLDRTSNIGEDHGSRSTSDVSSSHDGSHKSICAERERDVIIVGGGHNGLIAAAYLARAGLDTLVLERRPILGGAATTEEIFPGFKFSRFSYLAGLLRPSVVEELDLHKHGLTYLSRTPSSFTPSPHKDGLSLTLGVDEVADAASVAQFSKKDAEALPRYEAMLSECRELLQPLLDGPPPRPLATGASTAERIDALRRLVSLGSSAWHRPGAVFALYELFTAPAAHILNRWFESDILKTTLATDAVIGALLSPSQPGSAYILLHHVMGEVAGRQGIWAYVQGGMGEISRAITAAGEASGVEFMTSASVQKITTDGSAGRATGVLLADGTQLLARRAVLSNANPHHTFLDLLSDWNLPSEFAGHVKGVDYSCGAFKINLALKGLPNFKCLPNNVDGSPGPQHHGTIHFETQMQQMEDAYRDALCRVPARRPIVEMTIPSALDHTLAPPGKHVCQLFVQFAPYDIDPAVGSWDHAAFKEAFVERVFDIVEDYAPGFRELILGVDAISPRDLEDILGLHQGNIFHGSLALHQLGFSRPVPGWSSHRTPVPGLYLCGAGTHPGGGVTGAPGRNCAKVVLGDFGIRWLP